MTESSAGAALYDAYYYQHCCGQVYVRNEIWLREFGRIADHIHRDIDPRSVLDVGCAMGFLVETLHERGIEAFGIDISDYAIQQVIDEIKPYCAVKSVLDPLPRAYDLIVCIEVLEHLTPAECDQAIANICQATDDVLFSSTPDDFHEATHINVRPSEYWAGIFARYGFYRDVDYDASYITPWAMRFIRAHEPAYRLVEAYERRLWHLTKESRGAREFALESRGQIAAREAQIAELTAKLAEREQANAWLRAETVAVQADRQRLTAELQATQNEQQQTAAGLQAALAESQRQAAQVKDILSSPGWRFVTRVGQIRLRLMPRGSRRERFWFSIIKKLAA
ncbi:MAG TPA: methyltransferase domain-containing protein [Anaerolineae bacterium]